MRFLLSFLSFYLNSHFFFSFSAGAIAGIVIGATAGALLLVGVAVAAATKMRSDSSSSSGVAKQRNNKGVPVMNPESAARRVEEHEMTRFVSSFPCLPALLPRYLPFFTLFPFLQCDWKEQVLKHQNKLNNFSFTFLNKCGLTKFSNCFNNIFFYLPQQICYYCSHDYRCCCCSCCCCWCDGVCLHRNPNLFLDNLSNLFDNLVNV